MMTAGRRGRERIVAIAVAIFLVFAHLLAWYFVGRYVDVGTEPDKPALVVITGTVLLSWSLLMSQAMESVTRAFYARSDLDLILSSPAAARKIFAVRIAAMALSVIVMAALLGAPLINVLIARGGARWLGAYGVVIAMGATAAAGAVALTVAAVPPDRAEAHAARRADRRRRDRGGLHHRAAGRRDPVARHALAHGVPGIRHAGCAGARARQPRVVAGARRARRSHGARGRARRQPGRCSAPRSSIFSARFGDHAIAASSVAATGARQAARSGFRLRAAARVLRQKEWTLLARDPWLVSQTLMQMLYLLPPALLLWRSYGEGTGALVVLVPVLVMAAGQLAGGLAWLAISGEDAPDLVATAPIPRSLVVRAKIEAVLGAIAIAFAPFIAALAFLSLSGALASALGIFAAAAAATAHPVLLPQAGDAALLPPPPDRLALRDVRRSVLVDLVGRDRCGRGGRLVAGALPGRDRARHPRSGVLDEPAQALRKMAGLAPGHFISRMPLGITGSRRCAAAR